MRKLLSYISLIIMCSLYSCTDQNILTYPDVAKATLQVQAKGGTIVGHSLVFFVKSEPKHKLPIKVILENGLNTNSINAYTNSNILLDKNYFIHAGRYTISIYQNEKLLVSKNFKLEPRELIDPIALYTGPTTIVTGGKEASMITAIPADPYDNPAVNKEAISYSSVGGQSFTKIEQVQNLYVSTEFTSASKSEKIVLGVTHKDLASREQIVWQTPGWGASFKIESQSIHPYADNRQYSRIRTSKILDEYANQVPDGTLIIFDVYDESELVGSYKAITIDGIANVYIKNPAEATEWKIQAHIERRTYSNAITLRYKQNLKSISYNYDSFTNTLTVGPLNSVLGQYIPDGTLVTLSIDDLTVSKECLDGFATFPLLQDGITKVGPGLITVSGLKKKIMVK